MKQSNKVDVSIIIVRYRVVEELFECLNAIRKSKTKSIYEVILVDNDTERPVEKEINKNYKWVKYIKNPRNMGFGPANNIGARYAKGTNLFFLNSDTLVHDYTIDTLIDYLNIHENTGIVAPLLLQEDKKPYEIQGGPMLTPVRAIFALSVLNKLLPVNPVARQFYKKWWDEKKPTEMEAIPGSAVMIRQKLFKEVGEWDDKFFIYFEEFDLCRRVREMDYKIYTVPQAKLVHLWERSTNKEKGKFMKIFKQSRFYYFRKHYGFLTALFVESILRISFAGLAVTLLMLLSAFLNLFRLQQLMTFIGDQGWFYLSARDMLVNGTVPLVGITSSHVWLHQGPLWTYITALCLAIGRFNPVAPAVFTALVGVLSVWFIYIIGRDYFNKKVGLVSAALYAASPLIVINARMPYHTSMIPICTLLYFYSVYKWVKGNVYYFPVVILSVALLYNFELATVPYWISVLLIFLYGCIKREKWIKGLGNIKVISLSILAFVVPMLPVLIYDYGHRFPQTIGYIAWMGYKVLTVFGYPKLHPDIPSDSIHGVMVFAAQSYQQLVYPQGVLIAFTLFVLSFGYFYFLCFDQIRKNKEHTAFMILGGTLLISIIGFFAARTVSDAYLPLFFVPCILLIGIVMDRVMHDRNTILIGIAITGIIIGMNIFTLFQNNFSLNPHTITLQQRMDVSKFIVKKANGEKYNLYGKGEGSKFASYTMNYQYLTWYLGNEASTGVLKLQFIIQDTPYGIKLDRKRYN